MGFCEDEAKLGSIVKVYQKETAANQREQRRERDRKNSVIALRIAILTSLSLMLCKLFVRICK